jgi:hypothetical protein
MRKKFLTSLIIALAISLLVVPMSYAGFAGKLRKHIKREFVELQFGYVTSGAGAWVECAQVTIVAPKAGDVKVSASGMIVFPNANDVLTMTLHTVSADRGKWVFSTDGNYLQNFNVELVFPVEAGTHTFYFNATSYTGGGGTINVETGLLEALFMSDKISPSSAVEAAVEEPLSDESNE